jgi:hypothetical protein
MMAVRGKIQREGAVVHLVAHHLTDLSEDLASVGERDGGFPLPHVFRSLRYGTLRESSRCTGHGLGHHHADEVHDLGVQVYRLAGS